MIEPRNAPLMQSYFHELTERIGAGWNRFWYTPSDPLTLSALRLLVGLVATYTISMFTFDLLELFGPDGLLPTNLVQSLQEGRTRFSVLDYVHSPSQLWAVHAASLAILVLFTIGAFTRVTSVLAIVVFLSYMHRALVLTSQYEPIIAFLLFYLCLGPSGAYLSVDSWLARRRRASGTEGRGVAPSVAATIARRLIQVHLTVVYFMMAMSKVSAIVWWNGTALWWLMINGRDPLIDFNWLRSELITENSASDGPRGITYLVNAWTHAILLFELVFPLLAWNRLSRPLILAIGVLVWASVALVTGLASFATIMVVANLAFLTPDAMRSLLSIVGYGPRSATAGV